MPLKSEEKKSPASVAGETPPCLLCGAPAAFYCALKGGTYFRCRRCQTLFLHPTPTQEEMREYADGHYRSGVYAEYTRARPLKMETFRRRLALLKKYKTGGRLLDLGCACGFLIEAALEAGFDAGGVEFSREAINAAAPAVRGRIRHGDINKMDAGQFDVITAFDVLEHTRDPLVRLKEWAELLRPGGVLMLTMPDTDSLFRKLMGSRWPMLQPFQHTFLFSGSRFGGVLERAGLEPLEVRSAEKVMSADYLVGQMQIYFPRSVRAFQFVRPLLGGLTARPLPFRIGEFLALARKPGGNGDAQEARRESVGDPSLVLPDPPPGRYREFVHRPHVEAQKRCDDPMTLPPPDLTIVVPVYKEEDNIRPFLARVEKVFAAAAFRYEVLFCLDPSPDGTENVIREEIKRNPNLRLAVFSRRFGQPSATMAGLLLGHAVRRD